MKECLKKAICLILLIFLLVPVIRTSHLSCHFTVSTFPTGSFKERFSPQAAGSSGVGWRSFSSLIGEITTPPVLAYQTASLNRQVVYLGSDAGLTSIDVQTGEILWFHRTPAAVLSITPFPDLNADGFTDVVLTHFGQKFNNTEFLDGHTGNILWSFAPTQNLWQDGLGYTQQETISWSSTLLDDISGDAFPDLLISTYAAAFALDGFSGKVLWIFKATNDLWSGKVIADVNADGYSDIALGSQEGSLYFVSALDGQLLWERVASAPEYIVDETLGELWYRRSVFDIYPIADVTGDSIADVLITNENGYCAIYNSVTGNMLTRVQVYSRVGEVPPESSYGSKDFYNVQAFPIGDPSSLPFFLTMSRSSSTFGNNSMVLLSFAGTNLQVDWSTSVLPSNEIRGIASEPAVDFTGEYTRVIFPAGYDGDNNGKIVEVRSLENNSLLASWEIPVLESSISIDLNLDGESFSYPLRGNYALFVDDFNGSADSEVLVYFVNCGLFALDGATGEILWQQTIAPKVRFEPFGDINDDGTIDLLKEELYFPDAYRGDIYYISELALLSGATGELFWNFSLPLQDRLLVGGGFFQVIFLEDLTDDNITDIWAVTKEKSETDLDLINASKIYLIDGASGEMLWEAFPTNPASVYSKEQLKILSITPIQDQDNDNHTDLLIGSRRNYIYCISGATGAPLWNLTRDGSPSDPNYRDFIPWNSGLINVGNVLGNTTDDLIILGDNEVKLVEMDNFSTIHWVWHQDEGWVDEQYFSYHLDPASNNSCLVIPVNSPDKSEIIFLDIATGTILFKIPGDISRQIIRFYAADFNDDGVNDHVIFQPQQGDNLEAGCYIFDGATGELLSFYAVHKSGFETNFWLIEEYIFNGLQNLFDIIDDIDGDGKPELLFAWSLGRYNKDESNQGMLFEVISPKSLNAKPIYKYEIAPLKVDEFSNPPIIMAPFIKFLGDISNDGFPDILVSLYTPDLKVLTSIISLDTNLNAPDETIIWKQISQPVFYAADVNSLFGDLHNTLVFSDFYGQILTLDSDFEVVIDTFKPLQKSNGLFLLEWSTNIDFFISEVLLDDQLVAIARKPVYELFLGNEAHNITITVIEANGIRTSASLLYTGGQMSGLFIIWLVIVIPIIGYLTAKIVVKVKRKEDLTQFGPEIELGR
ncbi:MAG: hypothetical protein K9W42_14170 [Candidatus Heimdallarchaeota archaeon]|nr:hypothetical protein [Candidatus Heimdallarchaeota archaeon]